MLEVEEGGAGAHAQGKYLVLRIDTEESELELPTNSDAGNLHDDSIQLEHDPRLETLGENNQTNAPTHAIDSTDHSSTAIKQTFRRFGRSKTEIHWESQPEAARQEEPSVPSSNPVQVHNRASEHKINIFWSIESSIQSVLKNK